MISTLRNLPTYLPFLLKGAVKTIELSVLAMVLAIIAGLALVLMRSRRSGHGEVAVAGVHGGGAGTPLLIQLYFIYYGLPQMGIKLNAFLAGILGLGLNYAASEAENYRAGLQAVPRGQMP